jgi:hypothetical protein
MRSPPKPKPHKRVESVGRAAAQTALSPMTTQNPDSVLAVRNYNARLSSIWGSREASHGNGWRTGREVIALVDQPWPNSTHPNRMTGNALLAPTAKLPEHRRYRLCHCLAWPTATAFARSGVSSILEATALLLCFGSENWTPRRASSPSASPEGG